ncbi:extracellular solute-binding protein [Limobrevibacterium gyesilva]|uniref:Extracellular solute-binding protein n=1 Tax=Limobrevibacterium gyesilva TaxID=2991712 RepID=A0AA42CG57_9PROT|nr:extracellular solute-binding protein [Limobrevibacterium gyesilva]MCW3473495.1 extracellular solute-binding protein [Limobrevibacterium gyesilva]
MGGKRIGRLVLAATAAWGLAASAARAGEITFWTWRQEDKAAYTELFNDFTKANPDIHVKFEAFAPENYATIVSAALAGGRGGDVLHVRAYGGLEQFAKAGYLMPLDPQTVPELANLPDDAKAAETLRADGKVYAVSFASQTLGLLINKDVFAKAGVQPPETWDQLLSVSRTLKDKGIIPIANGTATAWMDEVFTGIFTGPFLGTAFVQDILAGRATFEDPRYVAALGRLLELRDFLPPGYTGIDYATGQQLFLSGRAAMFAGGSFEIANFRKQNPKLALDFIAPPAPKAGEPRYVSKFYDGGYAVNAKAANKADATRLVRWMGTKEYGDKFSALLGNISPIKGVVIQDPLLAQVAKLNDVSMPYIMAVHFRYESPTGSELLQGAVQRMLAGNLTPQQVGAEVTQGIARYYVPFQKK